MLEEFVYIVFDIPFSYMLGSAELQRLTNYIVDEPTLADAMWARTLDCTAMCVGPCYFCDKSKIVVRDMVWSCFIPRAQ